MKMLVFLSKAETCDGVKYKNLKGLERPVLFILIMGNSSIKIL